MPSDLQDFALYNTNQSPSSISADRPPPHKLGPGVANSKGSHSIHDLVQPLERSRQLDFNPAWGLSHFLARVVDTPALDKADPNVDQTK